MIDPFEEGRQAYLQGLLLKDCPYPEDSIDAVEWEGGFMEEEENTYNGDIL